LIANVPDGQSQRSWDPLGQPTGIQRAWRRSENSGGAQTEVHGWGGGVIPVIPWFCSHTANSPAIPTLPSVVAASAGRGVPSGVGRSEVRNEKQTPATAGRERQFRGGSGGGGRPRRLNGYGAGGDATTAGMRHVWSIPTGGKRGTRRTVAAARGESPPPTAPPEPPPASLPNSAAGPTGPP